MFALAAAPSRIKCPCGKSELTIDFQPDQVHMTVPCVFCGTDHRVSCPSRAFAERRALAFSCGASGLDCCYVGEEGPVYAATARLEQALDKLEGQKEEGRGTFLDPVVMEEVLSENQGHRRPEGHLLYLWQHELDLPAELQLHRPDVYQMRGPGAHPGGHRRRY